ncbi:MAG: hypothetical protein RBT70_09405, partial [Alphaproteobacteria bacterium]|jgi:hypothetical protein|nr:hypothetical protein [Alphaproteobacteria bacterium]
MHFKTSNDASEQKNPITAGLQLKRGLMGRSKLSPTSPDEQNTTPIFETSGFVSGVGGRSVSSNKKKPAKKSTLSFGITSIRKRERPANGSEDEEEEEMDASKRVSQRSHFMHLSDKKNKTQRTHFKSSQPSEGKRNGIRGNSSSGRDKSYREEYLKRQKLEKKKVEARTLEESKLAEEKREKKKETDARARALFLQEQMFMWKSKIDSKEFAPEVIAEQIRLIELEYFSINQRFRPW